MAFKQLITLASLTPAITALAFPYPSTNVGGNPDGCVDTDQHCYWADVGYYTDKDCTQEVQHECYHSVDGETNPPMCGDSSPDLYGCAPGNGLSMSPFWVKMKDAHEGNEDVQVLFTEDQSCPPSGPGAVFATLSYNDNCVQINRAGSSIGVSIYPNGGASVAARSVNASSPALKKRDDPKCNGFNKESESQSESQSVQISAIVDCTNGQNNDGTAAPCSISESQQYSKSVTTSYSATAGGGIEGIFEVSATFGMDYTEEETTSLQESVSVGAGSKGYLSAYSSATLFKGTFTGCDDGMDRPGQALVLKQNGFTYVVVNTGSS